MRAGERLISPVDRKEIMLFPLEYMYISQGEGGSYSHAGTYNIDFLGYDSNGRVYNCPYYAPCSCHCVWAGGSDNIRIYESDDEVHRADGTVGYATFLTMHDNNPIASVGDSFIQGELIGHTGTAGNVTGDHVHFNTAKGQYAGTHHVPPDNQYELVGSEHIYDVCYVNDTTLVQDYGYRWKTFQGGIDPSEIKKRKNFKWILFKNHIRASRGLTNI